MARLRILILAYVLISFPAVAATASDFPVINWYELPATGAAIRTTYSNLDDETAKTWAISELSYRFVKSQCAQRIAYAAGAAEESLDLGYATIAVEHANSFWQDAYIHFENGGLHWMTPDDFAMSFSATLIEPAERIEFQKATLKQYSRKNADRVVRVALWTWINDPIAFEKYFGKKETLERMTGSSYFHLAYLLRMQLGLDAILRAWKNFNPTGDRADRAEREAVEAVDLQRDGIHQAFVRVYTGTELVRDATLNRNAKSSVTSEYRDGLSLVDARARLAALENSEIPPATHAALQNYLNECERLGVTKTYPLFEAMLDEVDLFLASVGKP